MVFNKHLQIHVYLHFTYNWCISSYSKMKLLYCVVCTSIILYWIGNIHVATLYNTIHMLNNMTLHFENVQPNVQYLTLLSLHTMKGAILQ